MMPSIGPMEMAIVLVLLLLVFGPKKLPELGRGIGGGMREFKESVAGALPGGNKTEEKVAEKS